MQTKVFLAESELPTHWYNLLADMRNKAAPYLGPDGNPVTPDAMMRIFPEALVMQEMTTERWVEIAEPVREALRVWRPWPLYRAHRLEKALGTPAKIFYKNESVSPAGSHKPNTAVAQAITTSRLASTGSPPRPSPASGAARSVLALGLLFFIYRNPKLSLALLFLGLFQGGLFYMITSIAGSGSQQKERLLQQEKKESGNTP